jgi:hypothetical protein
MLRQASAERAAGPATLNADLLRSSQLHCSKDG